MLYDVIISPIETILEWSFLFITNYISFAGVLGAVIGVSLIVNFLALPLYNAADDLKDKERQIQLKIQSQADRIKKFFKGDERFMMMQTMYRQNNYHPFYSLRSSLAILIEIPFFIAAYHYLSNNEILQSADLNLGFVTLNLGQPDHMFKIGSFFINVLPVTMTLINVISSMIYSKGAPRKELVQLYALSAIFLVLLYDSPSGLVIYWICNNIFSLVKNALRKSKYAKKILYVIFLLILFFACYTISSHNKVSDFASAAAWAIFLLFLLFPVLALYVFKDKTEKFCAKLNVLTDKTYPSVFAVSAAGLALLLGFLLPSSVVATSPIEFSCLGDIDNPYTYVLTSLAFFTGLCIVWPLIIYRMFSKKVKYFLSMAFFILFVSALSNVYLFSFDYGNISQTFAFESAEVLNCRGLFYVIPPLLVVAASFVLFLLLKNSKVRSIVFSLLCSVCLAETAVGIYKSDFILTKYNANKENLLSSKNGGKMKPITPVFNLAKADTGKKNVVVIFLDRGINSFIPRFLEHFPELKNSFDGFTWYKNTLSFGNFTTVGAPAMIGGYEYMPEKINERKDEFLRDKHNEACLVMPKLFLDAGWNVTVTDPPLPNYSEKTDLSAFKKYPEMNVSELAGRYDPNYLVLMNAKGREVDKVCVKQSRNFCITQALFPALRFYFYCVVRDSINESTFEHYYSSLYFFNELTEFSSAENNFFFIENDATHPNADSPDWGADGRLFISEEEIKKYYDFKDSKDLVHYRVNALCIKEVGKWLDFLKKNNAYDNTRVILVSDHGRGIHLEEFENFENDFQAPAYFAAMFMYKDFNSHGEVKTDDTFMMNADSIFLAKDGLNLSDVNPFTGKRFVQDKDNGVNVYYAETTSATKIYNNKLFDLKSTKGWNVKDNIFDRKNWKRLE
ncbi:MAG: YidC/Oxa1 family membrane protein insertase [Treponema sp.]|nr:YidC/Oxa1 family membrane protein insertase [Treponema sp.]